MPPCPGRDAAFFTLLRRTGTLPVAGVRYGRGSAANHAAKRRRAALRPGHGGMVESRMNELDFSGKRVLVIGGSSGIGNGIAQAFRARGADVQVCGTRADASAYPAAEGSDLEGLHYTQLDLSDAAAIERFQPAFDRLDVLVLAQGAVIYRRGEF